MANRQKLDISPRAIQTKLGLVVRLAVEKVTRKHPWKRDFPNYGLFCLILL